MEQIKVPGDDFDSLQQARQAAAADQILQAVSLYEKVVSQHPHQPEAAYELALLFYRLNRLEEALQSFRQLLAIDPRDSKIWNNIAVIHCRRQEWALAEQCFQKALENNPRYSDAWFGLAKVCARQGRQTEANQSFRAGVRADPTGPRSTDIMMKLMADTPLPQKYRIGFVSIWFERGQAVVTKMIRDLLAQDHETFVFARTGNVFEHKLVETHGYWRVDNLLVHPDYHIQPETLVGWIRSNRLDIVVFNEEYDWALVAAVKSTGARILTYLDYYKDEWAPGMSRYDAVLCSTRRSYNLLQPVSAAYHIGWAVDTNLFAPHPKNSPRYTFFHNAGWLGIDYRKMTPAAILAFDELSRQLPEISLLVHAQTGPDRLPEHVQRVIRSNHRITYRVETIPAPGLYHLGKIHLFPSKLEGLGLPLLEGLACGLPAIVADAPPMNEFVHHLVNGLTVRVALTRPRRDGVAFPETIVDMHDLVAKMKLLATDEQLTAGMACQARDFALTQLNPQRLKKQLDFVLWDCLQAECTELRESLASPMTNGVEL